MRNMKEIKVLDFGYVKLIETWGSDENIIASARMSTSGSFKGWGPFSCPGCKDSPIAGSVFQKMFIDDGMGTEVECPTCKGKGELEGDEKLLRYLYRNNHMSPFEMAGMIIEVQAPIFIFREWHRHRVQSFNEMSARYTPIPDVNYIPTKERLLIHAGTGNKQAGTIKGSEELHEQSAIDYLEELHQIYGILEASYQSALKRGVPKEIARIILPVGRYSRMRASANLRNWLQFLSLRLDTGAQWEIRQYAEAVSTLLTEKFPRTMALFSEN